MAYRCAVLNVSLYFLASWTCAVAADPLRPNIVVIMCDDMGFSDIGCYGGEVQTPHLDRLAAEGMRFTQFYNNAKCTTTRASLVTGLYPRFGKARRSYPFGRQHLRRNMWTLGEAMVAAGYSTSLSGKWHLGSGPDVHPFSRGFQSFYGLLDGCCNFFSPAIPDPPYKGGRVRRFGWNAKSITRFPAKYYTTDAFTDHAIRAIQTASWRDEPFFVHLTYTAPHYPLHALPEDVAKYRGKFREGWDTMRSRRWQRQQALGLTSSAWRLSGEDSRAYPWTSADADFEDHRMAVYAAMIDRMDQNIGRLLKTLEETGHARDTLVLFFSDNGGCAEEPGGRDPQQRHPGPAHDYVAVGPAWGWAQNTPFRRYKSWLHEGGVATPCIAWWPEQIPANAINRSAAHIIDVMPTCLELAGIEYPEQYAGHDLLPLEGRSLLPQLRGESTPRNEPLAWYWAGNRALREGPWKIVWDKLGTGRWELYNLQVDRCELDDLASVHPERAEAMANRWHAWASEMELDIPQVGAKKRAASP